MNGFGPMEKSFSISFLFHTNFGSCFDIFEWRHPFLIQYTYIYVFCRVFYSVCSSEQGLISWGLQWLSKRPLAICEKLLPTFSFQSLLLHCHYLTYLIILKNMYSTTGLAQCAVGFDNLKKIPKRFFHFCNVNSYWEILFTTDSEPTITT